jgi:hypothetical protein
VESTLGPFLARALAIFSVCIPALVAQDSSFVLKTDSPQAGEPGSDRDAGGGEGLAGHPGASALRQRPNLDVNSLRRG